MPGQNDQALQKPLFQHMNELDAVCAAGIVLSYP